MEQAAKYEVEEVRPRQSEALVAVEEQRAVAETRAAMQIAKMFPRNIIEAQDKIMNACTRPGLAEAALYEYARGGTAITGPSIRLAEAIAQNWQNLQFGIRELEQRSGASTVEAYAWDVEQNVRQVKVFQVKHERSTKRGRYALEDSRDIYEMVANQGARRLRACILGIIPGDVVEAAVEQCEATLKAKADTSEAAVKKLSEAFAGFGVTKEQIEKKIQRRLDTITPAQIIRLRKIYTSLKDGMSVAADWFEVEESKAETKADALKEKLKGKKKEPPKTESEPPAQAQAATSPPDTKKCPNVIQGDPVVSVSECEGCESRGGCPAWE